MLYCANYAWHDWWKNGFAEDGDVFEGCNLSQAVPGTPIGLKAQVGTGLETCATPAKGLVFRRCNLANCLPPEDAVVEDCMVAQTELCSHLHPELVERGLPECPEKCSHVQPGGDAWQPTSEKHFRFAKAISVAIATVRLVKVEDSLGVVTGQRFEALAPLYRDKALPKWRPPKAEGIKAEGGKS